MCYSYYVTSPFVVSTQFSLSSRSRPVPRVSVLVGPVSCSSSPPNPLFALGIERGGYFPPRPCFKASCNVTVFVSKSVTFRNFFCFRHVLQKRLGRTREHQDEARGAYWSHSVLFSLVWSRSSPSQACSSPSRSPRGLPGPHS